MRNKIKKIIDLKFESMEEDSRYIIDAQVELLANIRMIQQLLYSLEASEPTLS